MKNSKKLSVLLVLIFLSVCTFGQVSFGVKAGLNLSNIAGDDTEDMKIKPGFQIGLTTDIELGAIGIQPSLLLSTKGAKMDVDPATGKINLFYVEVPVNVYYGIPIGDNALQIIAGPYVGIGVSGKAKFEYEGETEETDIQFVGDIVDADEDKIPMNRLDFGLNFGAGFKTGPVQIQLLYGLGLGNLNPKYDGETPDDKNTNSNIQITGAFFF
ncbi:MAG: PorT family protein [Bacteroidales bacterium]|nr:PorT family protein [Bacteroidales bacterium]